MPPFLCSVLTLQSTFMYSKEPNRNQHTADKGQADKWLKTYQHNFSINNKFSIWDFSAIWVWLGLGTLCQTTSPTKKKAKLYKAEGQGQILFQQETKKLTPLSIITKLLKLTKIFFFIFFTPWPKPLYFC